MISLCTIAQLHALPIHKGMHPVMSSFGSEENSCLDITAFYVTLPDTFVCCSTWGFSAQILYTHLVWVPQRILRKIWSPVLSIRSSY